VTRNSFRRPSFHILKAGLHLVFVQTSQGVEGNRDIVSLVKLKEAARKLLPADSIARSIITAEPDTLPLAEALSKFKVFDALILEELGAARRPR
jgi:hypothetical protein